MGAVRAQEIGFIEDPYPVYDDLRRERPIVYDEATDHWLVSRYTDVNAILRDRRFGRTYLHVASHEEMGHEPPPDWHDPFWRLINAGILDMEGADHTRVRRLVSKAFTPAYAEALRPRIEALVADLTEPYGPGDRIDLLPTVAEPLPVTVIAEMLGIPQADRGHLRPWSGDMLKMYELDPTEEMQRDAVRASQEFSDYLRELARTRRGADGDA